MHHCRCRIVVVRELQQSIAREPSAPSFSVPAYQSTPAAPAAGPTPAPRTVFVSILSQSQTLSIRGADVRTVIMLTSAASSISLSTCLAQQPEQQPQAKPQPPARPPPPTFTPQAASSTPPSVLPSGPPSTNPPPVAPPSQAQGPPYPTYQGYPGCVSCLISD